jgi:transposase
VHPIKSFVYQKVSLACENLRPVIEVRIVPRKNAKPVCSGCRCKGPTYDHMPGRRTFDFVPLWNIPVRLSYCMRRVDCKACGVTVEAIPWAEGKHRSTNALRLFLSRWAKHLSWKQTARQFHTSWDTVFRSVEWVVDYGLAHRCLEGVTAIGIDEVAYTLGHHYMTLIYQIDAGSRRLIGVVKDRKESSLAEWLDTLGAVRRAAITVVCSDMWPPYLNVVRRMLPHALNILDRFHIVKKLNEAVDETRRQETKRLHDQGYDPVLSKSRYCFLKRPENLTERQRTRLDDLLAYDLKTVRAYGLKEAFDVFWKYTSPRHARDYMRNWCARAMRSRIEPLKKFVKTLRKHEELLMNYFEAKKLYNSGMVEGFNLKVGLTIRKAFGFRNFGHLQTALYHQLGDLPEPKFTHRFCG